MKKIGRMNSYTPDSPPKGGTAKKLWHVLHDAGFEVGELHYNPNCWGHDGGWGGWAFTEKGKEAGAGFHCYIGFGKLRIARGDNFVRVHECSFTR